MVPLNQHIEVLNSEITSAFKFQASLLTCQHLEPALYWQSVPYEELICKISKDQWPIFHFSHMDS
jgi:hypothetical protein